MAKKLMVIIAFVFISCGEENQFIVRQNEWQIDRMTFGRVTSFCYFGDEGHEPEWNELQNALFFCPHPASIIFREGEFEIRNGDTSLLRGNAFHENEQFVLQTPVDSIHLTVRHQSSDSILWFTKGADAFGDIEIMLVPIRN